LIVALQKKLTELQAQITEDTSTKARIMIIMIAAASEIALGKNNELVWRLPNDFKGSRTHWTSYYYGAKTFESFPKPLPNRTHVVISRQDNYKPEGCSSQQHGKSKAICPRRSHTYTSGGGI
jgi:dihydrofolate reductase